MITSVLAGVVALIVVLIVLSEILAAVIPLIIVLTCVPAAERDGLARVLAVIDSSRRLRVWSALKLAVVLRRQEIEQARTAQDPLRNPYAHLNDHFANLPGDAPLNPPYERAEPVSPPVRD
ncbi:hypothetical protein M1L60_35880 [Actinoplanes sp. TRM 88003]|uniref:Uncharacterized protein n=1 Tax=Paractinoplanes aksuensis TaxID=2939490 RepID=A0ABT1DYM4_9ACTN|nr:hypothetical protein [Actinoplanes aksuensis]MCO8275972.1 hypothetical protein [Actinoplanes aksuensis]